MDTRTLIEIIPSLDPERLQILARAIERAHVDALASHDPRAGETSLSLGTRRYERARKFFIDMANSGEHPWLGYTTAKGAFYLLLENFPLKFHHENPDYPSSRKRGATPEERNQLDMFVAVTVRVPAEEKDFHWRLFYQALDVFSCALVRLDSDDKERNRWVVDMAGTVSVIAPVVDIRQGVEIEKPAVGPRPLPRREAAGDEDKDDGENDPQGE
jgi:hypothetical protein